MMDLLPPTGWGDVATRRDLDVLRAEFKTELGGVRVEMAEMRADIAERMRAQTLTMTSVFVGALTLAVAVMSFLG